MRADDYDDIIKTGKVGDGILTAMLIIMTFLFGVVLCMALINVFTTNGIIEHTIKQIPLGFQNHLFNKDGSLSPLAQAYLQQLELKSKGTLDSNTISFLFQMFAIALVTAGVFLLSRVHENYRKTREKYWVTVRKAGLIVPFVRNNQKSISLTSCFFQAYNISWLIKEEGSECHVPIIRQVLSQIEAQLVDADIQKVGFEKQLYDSFLDFAKYIEGNLSLMRDPNNPASPQADIPGDIAVETCKKIMLILQKSDFVNRYNRQMEALVDNSKETND